MTILDDAGWTPDAWAARLASGNPVFPFEWTVRYHTGGLFKRVCRGIVRTSADVPLDGIDALIVEGPWIGRVEFSPPPGRVLGLVIAATVIGQLGTAITPGVARWRFGFRNAAGVWGIAIDHAGRLTYQQPSTDDGQR